MCDSSPECNLHLSVGVKTKFASNASVPSTDLVSSDYHLGCLCTNRD